MDNGHRCDICRISTVQQLLRRDRAAHDILHRIRKDRQRNIFKVNSARMRLCLPCPGCGDTLWNRYSSRNDAVVYCMACNGIEVKATLGDYYKSTVAVPIAPTRRSARIRAINLAKPAIDFLPNMFSD